MLTLEKIRADLKDIKYYSANSKDFEKASKIIGQSAVLEKTKKYNAAILDAPALYYNLYVSLYLLNNQQDALAFEWNYSPEYIKQLNRQLCEYFLNVFSLDD